MRRTTNALRYVAILAGAWMVAAAGAAPAELLVTSFGSNRVTRHGADGAVLGQLTGGNLGGPLATRLGPDGLLYVASESTNTIERYDAQTFAHVDTFVGAGSGGLDGPTGMTWDAAGNLYVASFNSDAVLKYDGQGAFVGTFVASGAGSLNGPDNGIIFGPDGDLYVPSYWSNRVLRYDGETGAFVSQFAVVARPRVLIFRGDQLLVTSEARDAVRVHDAATGAALGDFTAPGAGGMDVPIGMAFGPDGLLYVSSGANDNVLRYDGQTGAFVDEFIPAGAGGIDAPTFLTFVPEPSSLTALLACGLLLRRR